MCRTSRYRGVDDYGRLDKKIKKQTSDFQGMGFQKIVCDKVDTKTNEEVRLQSWRRYKLSKASRRRSQFSIY